MKEIRMKKMNKIINNKKIIFILSILFCGKMIYSQPDSNTVLLKSMYYIDRIELNNPHEVIYINRVMYSDGSYSSTSYAFITDKTTAYEILNEETDLFDVLNNVFFMKYDKNYEFWQYNKLTNYYLDYNNLDFNWECIYNNERNICIKSYGSSVVEFDVVLVKRDFVKHTYDGFIEKFDQPYYLMLKYVIPEKKKFKINIFKK